MRTKVRLLLHGLSRLPVRVRRDGVRATVRWLHGQAWPCLVGIPRLAYGRVDDHLLVGPQIGRAGKRALARWGYQASVNLRSEFDDAAHGLALPEHLHLPTIDGTPPTLDQLREGVAFLERVLSAGTRVYVHCESGVGRAPTLAAAFLVARGLSAEDAIAHVRTARPFIALEASQVARLREWEEARGRPLTA